MNTVFVTLVQQLADLGLDGMQIAAAVKIASEAASEMAKEQVQQQIALDQLRRQAEAAIGCRKHSHRAAAGTEPVKRKPGRPRKAAVPPANGEKVTAA